MKSIDSLLNRITMYRLVLYGLTLIAGVSVVFGYMGILAYSGTYLLLSLALILAVAFTTDAVFAQVLGITRNVESVFITSFILFFLLLPATDPATALVLGIGAFVAISSKYFFVLGKRHIFNPAAFGAVVLGLMGTGAAGWWVATPVLLPVVAVVGLLIVRKIRRFDVFVPFAATALVVGGASALGSGGNPLTTMLAMLVSWPLVFFGTIMLTEPMTAPTHFWGRVSYAMLVGVLFAIPFHVGFVYMTPALALLIGNLYVHFTTNTERITLTFLGRVQIAKSAWEFVFEPDVPFRHIAGQYLEWTVGHEKPDSRGNRRYFTVASAPDSPDVRLGVRISTPSSSFKQALMHLEIGDTITATAIAGDFTLPKDTHEPLVFIAGGIGITPFVSMLRDLALRNEARDIHVLYAASDVDEFAYQDVLREAKQRGVIVEQVTERLTNEKILSFVPDITKRSVYISGPDGMVRAMRSTVRSLGVGGGKIHTDYFPGL